MPGNGGSARIWIFTDITEAQSARIDPLTGLPNRRAYIREMPEFMAASSDELVKAFALLDFDLFKAYNDLYGHSAGDATLEHLGHLLQSQINERTDRVYRLAAKSSRSHPCIAIAKVPTAIMRAFGGLWSTRKSFTP